MPDQPPRDKPAPESDDALRPDAPLDDGSRASDAPETHNAEQDDEEAQAQTISEEVYRGSDLGLGDTEKVPTGNEGDDVQDLVDHMRQMESSGIIDMSAFAGERNDDEEEGRYGNAAEEE